MRSPQTPVILDPGRLKEEVDYFLEQEAFAFDVEAWGDNRGVPSQNTLNWISLSTFERTIVVPFGHPNGSTLISRARRKKNSVTGKFDLIPAVYDDPPEQMSASEVFSILDPLFKGQQVKVAHNATYDLISVVKYLGYIPKPPFADTIVMQWLLDENMKQKGLKNLIKRYWSVEYDFDNVGKRVEDHPFNTVAHYSYMDAKYTWFLYQTLLPRLAETNLVPTFMLEMQVLEVLLAMGVRGAKVDVAAIEELRDELSARVVDIEADVYRAAGKVFNINSNPQKQQMLYGSKEEGGQGLKSRKETPGGAPSTDSDALAKHPNNPLAAALLEYQEVNKLLGTYVIGYLGDPEDPKKPGCIFDGRVHTDLVQYGTVTGRFSSRAPNLQNIPRPDTDLGKKIRGLFVAPPGYRLVVADYGQIEMVLLAHFAGKGRLFDGLHAGVDPHTATAAGVFKVPTDEVTKDMRQVAKGINFAVVYGAGPDKVAAMSGVKLADARKFLKAHREQFPEIYRFKNRVIEKCKQRRPPHIRTLLGRWRRLPSIFAQDQSVAGAAERQAVNSLIQGSAADLIKLAMVRLHSTLPAGMYLTLSVHDELVVECPENRAEECADIVREAMLGVDIQRLISTPLTSDVKIVDRWSEAK